MPLTAHRQVPNRDREIAERIWACVGERLARVVICTRCNTTYRDYETRCLADLNEDCPGALAIAAAKAEARAEIAE